MIISFFRENVIASSALVLFRIYLGYQWLTSGWGKVTGGFDANGYLQAAVKKSTGEHPAVPGWWVPFLEGVAIPNVELFNILVPWGEVLVGIALILGLLTTFAGLMGITMNFAFLFSGTTSINPQMVLLTFFILVAGRNAGRFGLDYFLLPFIDKALKKNKDESIPVNN